jgi:hypothetical protein
MKIITGMVKIPLEEFREPLQNKTDCILERLSKILFFKIILIDKLNCSKLHKEEVIVDR